MTVRKITGLFCAAILTGTLFIGTTALANAEDNSVIVTMPATSEPASGFDPAYGWGAGEHVHEPLIQSTLVRTTTDLSIENDLATEYSCSEDGLTWTVKIRDDVKFTDGEPLTAEDVKELESILWSEVGTRQDYEAEVGQKPLGEFVREIVGMDMNAAKEAFAQYLNDVNLDSRQIYFVNQIVEYIVHNGVMKDLSVLQEPPFTDRGSIVEIFTDLSLWAGIKSVIDRINANAAA